MISKKKKKKFSIIYEFHLEAKQSGTIVLAAMLISNEGGKSLNGWHPFGLSIPTLRDHAVSGATAWDSPSHLDKRAVGCVYK